MSKRLKKERGWAIYSPHGGLYVGWWLTRKDAIAEHVAGKVCVGGRGDPAKRIWKMCQDDGDRAVQVTITYAQPPR